jgi:hypothetical protein
MLTVLQGMLEFLMKDVVEELHYQYLGAELSDI